MPSLKADLELALQTQRRLVLYLKWLELEISLVHAQSEYGVQELLDAQKEAQGYCDHTDGLGTSGWNLSFLEGATCKHCGKYVV